MPTVYLAPFIGAGGQFFTNNGAPLAGGKIFTYTAGTTTPQATYTDNTGNTPLANPIVLDSSGRISGGEVWITTALYKFVVQDSTGVTLGTYDNVGVTTTVLLSATPATSTTLGTVIVPTTGGAAVDGSGNITVPAVAVLTTLGDIPYVSANGTPGTVARLAGNITTTRKFLRQTGTGAASAVPVWDTLVSGDVPNNSATSGGLTGTPNISVGTLSATTPVILAAGNQEVGSCGAGGNATGSGTYYGFSGVNFKTTMTNIPSSITLAAVQVSGTTGNGTVQNITKLGFLYYVQSINNLSALFFNAMSYTTVGN